MATVMQVVQRLLPGGTLRPRDGAPHGPDWSTPPAWPPDLFAVAATLVELSGCYAHGSVPSVGSTARDEARELGAVWAQRGTAHIKGVQRLSRRLSDLWYTVLLAGHLPAARWMDQSSLPGWCRAALSLMALADEAAAGVGFDEPSGIGESAQMMHWGSLLKDGGGSWQGRRRSATLCMLVPPEECCVQPKARTPQVGCNLHTLSLNLALLPPLGNVTTRHWISSAPLTADTLGLLLVPFPYVVADDILYERDANPTERWGRFGVRQSWLPRGWPRRMATFIEGLVVAARAEGRAVDGVVLPEIALAQRGMDTFARELARRTGIRLLIAGALERAGTTSRNFAYTYICDGGAVVSDWRQSKHHRWRVDPRQIADYGLRLDSGSAGVDWWWEAIDVANREVVHHMFHAHGGLLAALVCEDLARIDPVQPTLRAVGPTLLVALLMDGPQLQHRWSGRYSANLTEDPGTSVLTLTCAAMARRWAATKAFAPAPPVALWRDPWTGVHELALEPAAHAIHLPLSLFQFEERTLDRRSCSGYSLGAKLAHAAVSVRHPRPPRWLEEVAPPADRAIVDKERP